jgi:predicted glycoside hydrolase/deacetylase ChbG (UPF0249 family)
VVIKKHFTVLAILWFFLAGAITSAQEQQNLAEKLGYDRDAKLLIIHADDIGLSSSVNRATIDAFEKGGISSGSIMVPCPWFGDFAAYTRDHPEVDVGIHITLTSEWENYRWDGVTPASEIPSLLDEKGYFYSSVEEVGANVDPAEAEKEIRAQIERAITFGINPTHLDTHMGSVLATPELSQLYMKLGKEYKIPFLLPRIYLNFVPEEIRAMLQNEPFLLDAFFQLNAEKPGKSWLETYRPMIEAIQPGLTQLIVHVAYDDEEMQAITVNHPAFGATWRQKDLDLVTSPEFKALLKEHNIQLVGWREIKALL